MAEAPHLLLLTTPSSYRLPAFLAAAAGLPLQFTVAETLPPGLPCAADRLALPGDDTAALAAIRDLNSRQPLSGIIAVDDSGSLLAAAAAAELGIPHNQPQAALAARDKFVMRSLFAAAGVRSPQFRRFTSDNDPAQVAAAVNFPCVVKPLRLNGSRGVIRADNPAELNTAIARVLRLLTRIDGPVVHEYLVEDYIPGVEVALEGLIDAGRLQVLALFDKPDPLEGPFFEETLYVTPSRLPADVQADIAATAAAAARAIGLERGPLHAELRCNAQGAWMVELAGRSIGGLCSRTLQFGTDASLEELIVRQAAGLPIASLSRSGAAGGVMMIPIPAAGILHAVHGLDAARAVAGIDAVEISAPLKYPLVPLPEGDAYLGFIFARGEQPADVEQALRAAHACLRFEIRPSFELQTA